MLFCGTGSLEPLLSESVIPSNFFGCFLPSQTESYE
uniref:Uncharacterized protein n=1 Tax=Anguilla anguilla TaxID=7936 RepID=A0A0E9WLF5_ANGAN